MYMLLKCFGALWNFDSQSQPLRPSIIAQNESFGGAYVFMNTLRVYFYLSSVTSVSSHHNRRIFFHDMNAVRHLKYLLESSIGPSISSHRLTFFY